MTEYNRAMRSVISEMTELRRHLHQHPELSLQEHATSKLVAERLTSWGYSVDVGLGGTGVVGSLKTGAGKRSIGIRADMDALPIDEATGSAHSSLEQGVMHACGHDGHTAILLAAARFLAETRKFNGTVNLIFQPAEERYNGAKLMVDQGLFDRFPCDMVFGLHNMPGLPIGKFSFAPGPFTCSSDTVYVRISGKGGHGAMPDRAKDPIVAAAHFVTAVQTIVSRNLNPSDLGVVTIGKIQGGTTSNVIPSSVDLEMSVRAIRKETQSLLHDRIIDIAQTQAAVFGCQAEVDYRWGCPAVVNDEDATSLAATVASRWFGDGSVSRLASPLTGSEDFSFMSNVIPGCYFVVGNGTLVANGAEIGLHSPHYDFNDACLPVAAEFWVHLVEDYLAVEN